jgi:two-component system cell cycle sensor histidine kinase/response regulator CckA
MEMKLKKEKIRILVVDDETYIHYLFKKVILPDNKAPESEIALSKLEKKLFNDDDAEKPKKDEFELVTCKQADEAVDVVAESIVESRPFAIVFLDVMMPPGPDGIWAAEQIRALDKHIEIVIISGYTDSLHEDFVDHVSPTHKLLFMQKPFHPQEIKQFVASLSNKWLMEKRLLKFHAQLEEQIDEKTFDYISISEELQYVIHQNSQTIEDLTAENDLLRVVVDNLPDCAVLCTPKGNCLLLNRTFENKLNYSNKDLQNQSLSSLFHPDDLEAVIDFVNEEQLLDSFLNQRKCRIKHNDGHYLWFEFLSQRVMDKMDNFTGVVYSLHDIEEDER